MNNEYYDYIESGFRVFGLHQIVNGKCGCEKEECDAAGKHPIASNWQNTPCWSDDQLDVMEELGQFDTGFGVLVSGYLVIDVDARNGGVESFKKLCSDLKIDLDKECGFIVASGSGNGSKHLYFKYSGKPLKQHHDKYQGIDFKSSGYVVGAGSLHISGNEYETTKGFPQDLTDAPESLASLLVKPDTYKAKTSLGYVDMSINECRDIVSYISPSCDYDTWVSVGMAIHQTFNGDGFDIWDDWSAKDKDQYPGVDIMSKKWHSFGKCSNPVQMGTLIHYAEQAGYQQSVEFRSDVEFDHEEENIIVDLKRPPGLAGDICQWINNSALYKRENLAVAAALTAIGNIGGLKYIDDRDGMTANMLSFCIAGSSTGKEHIQQRFSDLLRAAGIIDAMHGGIKSEQEIVRNLTRHQAAFYSIDEIGIVLNKIINSKNASYLEGVIGLIMSAYSKADSFLPVGGDVKETLKSELKAEHAACEKMISENESVEYNTRRAKQIRHALENISSGIQSPFLSLIGYTTPVTFNNLFSFEMATNGFLSRSVLFDEHETNPKPKKPTVSKDIPDKIANQLIQIYQGGSYSTEPCARIEFYGEKKKLPTSSSASELLDTILIDFWEMAEHAKDIGLEAIPRRGYELTAKISFILAIPEGIRTVEHVNWAYAFVKADIKRKMRLATANIEKEENPGDSIAVKIQDILQNSEDGETQGVIVNRCRPHKKDNVLTVLLSLAEKGYVRAVEYPHPKHKNKTVSKYIIK